MNWVLHETIKEQNFSPPFQIQLSPPPPISDNSNLQNKISPSILLIILILAIIFFISGLLHLLVRYLLRPNTRETEELDNSTSAFQGQLQQLFNLHDEGVDQSFIDTLPVFLYKAIIGLKDPFDCAVCLCEFNQDDKLRLLPKCSHAFHIECIDTWLLSHSTCPLCRSSLLPDYSPCESCSPLVFVLESSSDSSRELGLASERGELGSNTHVGSIGDDESGTHNNDMSQKTGEIGGKEENSEAKIVQVKLGKFRNVETNGELSGEGTSTSSSNDTSNKKLDQRRCYSMGSYEYIMDESFLLQVPVKQLQRKPVVRKPGHRVAMSECDSHSKREGFKGFEQTKLFNPKIGVQIENGDASSNKLSKKESYSVSKTWLRNKKDKASSDVTSRRALSFRLPVTNENNSKLKSVNSPVISESEYNVSSCDNNWLDLDLEIGNSNNSAISSRADEAPSFARRTLLWIMGRHEQR